MQYELQIFEYQDDNEFRVVDIEGEPWFVLADVCRHLELAPKNGSFSHHAERLDTDERRTVPASVLREHTSPSGREVRRIAPTPATDMPFLSTSDAIGAAELIASIPDDLSIPTFMMRRAA
jgi:hypothetical protein